MTTTASSDAELLTHAREGDEAAFTELYVRHHDAARRLAKGYPRAGDPDDLVNGSFERILGAIRRGSGPTDAFRAYLFVTLRRLATDQISRLHDDPVDEVPEPVRAVEQDPPLDHAERQLVLVAYESLPERTQAVLWQAEVEGRQPRELAGVLGMTANAAAALAYRAREKLRQAYLQAHLQAAPRPQCEPHRSRLGAYIREGLSNRDQGTTAAHLDACGSCQSLIGELLDVNRLLRKGLAQLFEATAPQIGAAVAAGGAVAGGGALLRQRMISKARSNATVAAGVLALIAAIAFALVSTTSDEQTLLPGSAPEVESPSEDAPPPDEPPPPEPEPEAEPPPQLEQPPPLSEPPPATVPEAEEPEPTTPPEPSPTTTAPPVPLPPPPTATPPRPALVVVWLDLHAMLQITVTNNTGLPTDGVLLEVNLEGGAVVIGAPSNCDVSLSLFTAMSCVVDGLRPGESVVVQVPVRATASGQAASTRACAAPLLDLVCLDFLAEFTTALR